MASQTLFLCSRSSTGTLIRRSRLTRSHISTSKFGRVSLRKAGYSEFEIERIITQCRESVANLQLLPGGENIGKGDPMPLEWAKERYQQPEALRGYLEQNDMIDLPRI